MSMASQDYYPLLYLSRQVFVRVVHSTSEHFWYKVLPKHNYLLGAVLYPAGVGGEHSILYLVTAA